MRYAEVAELADALRSGRSGITLVRVQIPPSAQKSLRRQGFFLLTEMHSWLRNTGDEVEAAVLNPARGYGKITAWKSADSRLKSGSSFWEG